MSRENTQTEITGLVAWDSAHKGRDFTYRIEAKHIDGAELFGGVLIATAAAHKFVTAESDGVTVSVYGLNQRGHRTLVATCERVGFWEGPLTRAQLEAAGVEVPTTYKDEAPAEAPDLSVVQ